MCGGVRWLFLLEHHNFLSFKMRRANYNYIEIKTGLKGILERVTPWKNMSNASQNLFYIFITMSPSFWWSKASLEWFSLMKYCLQYSNFYWIKSIWLETVQNQILYFCCTFELTGWDFCFTVTLTLYPVPQCYQPRTCSRNTWAEPLQCKMKKNILEVPLGLHDIPA